MTYWNNNGVHQADYDRLYAALVPMEGKCATIEGENLRAVSRIAYDFYNNGFGNNWSGAFNWLKRDFITSIEHNLLSPYARGGATVTSYDFKDDSPLVIAIDAIVNRVVVYALVQEPKGFQPNSKDMFDFQEPDEPWDDYIEDDYDYEDEDRPW